MKYLNGFIEQKQPWLVSVHRLVAVERAHSRNNYEYKNRKGDFSCETSPLDSDFRRSGSVSGSQLGSPRITRHSRTLARAFLALLRSLLPQELSRRHPFPVAWPESRCRFPKMTVCPLSPLEDHSSLESDTTPDRRVCKWSLIIFCCGNEVTDGGNSRLGLREPEPV
jgi:hypothetical protein